MPDEPGCAAARRRSRGDDAAPLDVRDVVGHGEAHVARARRHAQFAEELGQDGVVAFVVHDEPGVDRVLDAVEDAWSAV